MKILYMSCHAVEEFDEIKLFSELGHTIFSPGAYVDPGNPGDDLRPAIQGVNVDPEDMVHYSRMPCPEGRDRKDFLTKEFVDRFDAVFIMHIPRWYVDNWPNIRHKRVILRTIGQNTPAQERVVKQYADMGMHVIRYSAGERRLQDYAGETALIRFYKDPSEYGDWNGNTEAVMTCCQAMPKRGRHCGWALWKAITAPFPRHLYGPGNEEAGADCMGKVPYDQLKQAWRDHRVYFYTGTTPACYTLNFMEAWMTGIPVVALGRRLGAAHDYIPGTGDSYEVPDLLGGRAEWLNGTTGYFSDNPAELTRTLKLFLNDKALAQRVGQAGRKEAIRVFGKETIAAQWKTYFDSLT